MNCIGLGDIVRMDETSPYFADWRGVEMKVIGLRCEPDGVLWASVIEGNPRHRGNGYYDSETTDIDVCHLSLVKPRSDVAQGALRRLDWQETFTDRGDGSKDQTGWEADSGFGSWYSVEQYFGSDSYGWETKFYCEVISDHDDPEQAKKAAQDDFEIRASTLTSTDGGKAQ